jgi:uncharacterized protein
MLTKKTITFLALSFAITWAIVVAGWAAGLHLSEFAVAVLAASMFGPSLAAIICVFAFEKGRRGAALGLRFRPNWWWLIAWLIPVLLAVASVAFTVLLSPHGYADPAIGVIAMAEAHSAEAAAEARAMMPYLGIIILAQALLFGSLINGVVLTISEELGWRGYLYDQWRAAGFWRYSFVTGAIWGVWHAPIIFLFGHNYPDNRLLGVGLFVAFCMLISPMLTLVRDRGRSTWAAGIFHGTINAVGGLTALMVGGAAFPWNGLVGIGGYLALAIGVAIVFLVQRRAPTAAPANA